MTLTDLVLRNAKPADKDYKLSDGAGLYLLVKKNGSRLWRMTYRFQGVGPYPKVTLVEARDQCHAARAKIRAGIDPRLERKVAKQAQADTFEALTREWWRTETREVESGLRQGGAHPL